MNLVLGYILLCNVLLVASESLDGTKLSDRLKVIRDGVGVTHMQNIYNTRPFTMKTGDGNQLLHDIKTNIESSLAKLTEAVQQTKSEVLKQEQRFTNEATLPLCCQLSTDSLTYDPKFRHKVNFTTACITKAPITENTVSYPPRELAEKMKANYNNNKNVLWQHYGTKDGMSIIYPATYWTDCNSYDPRLRSEFAATASPRYKDVVIMIDSSSSMKRPSLVADKSKFVLAKEAARYVIQTLNPNDRIAALSFNNDVNIPLDCYSNTLSFATAQNIAKLKEFVSLIQDSTSTTRDFEKALKAAFSYFDTSSKMNDTNREQVIIFISDGTFTQGEDPRTVIRDENMKLLNRAVIFTYLLGPGVSSDVQTLFSNMSAQVQSNSSYGTIREGHYSYLETASTHKTLAIQIATFYLHLPDGIQRSKPTYSVTYVDQFSEVGLMTSLCLPAFVTSGFHGVACTDIKLSELLKEVEFFEEGNSSYAFMIDKTGRALVHPLLPDATYVKLKDVPVQVDITTLERSPNSGETIDKIKSGVAGSKQLSAVYFTIPRGTLVNDGSSVRLVKATYYWAPISDTNFVVTIVLGDESHSEISETEYQISAEDLEDVFMYHERSLTSDNFKNCRFNARLVTLDKTSVKFAPSAFENPFQYIDKDETAVDVNNYKKYFTKKTDQNPGFKVNVRADVWATYEAEKYWKQHESNHLAWRYIGTKSGIMRAYPGVSLTKTYDHEKRPWFRQTTSHPGMMYITPPYEDAWGSGILISQEQTIHKRDSTQVTAVLGTDFPLQYFSWFIDNVYPSCSASEYRCIIIEDNGFIVMHPSFKESTNADKFLKSIHITVEEPALANVLASKSVLNPHECQDYSVDKELRSYRVTMTVEKPNGLNFDDTDDQFELKPIPETNIFIIRQRVPSTLSSACKCDSLVKPDFRQCNQACNCLCFKNIAYDVCTNIYNTDGNLPCSARIPDASGVSTPEVLAGLPTCFNPQCPTKQSKSECFSEAECGWCDFTDEGFELNPKCCRLKEDCSFGKTTSTNRDTCGAITLSTFKPESNTKSTSESPDPWGAIGGAAGGGIIITLIGIGLLYLIRRRNICRNTSDPDPYIDAVPDITRASSEFDHFDHFNNDVSSCSTDSNYTRPPPYQSNSNDYTMTAFNHIVYDHK